MTQTLKSEDSPTSRRSRPGQRQQERLQRLARRRRRRTIIMSLVSLVLVAGLVYLGFWGYNTYTANQIAQDHVHATATAVVLSSPTPAANKPPVVTGVTKTMAGGLKYIDIKKGSGPAAKQGDEVDAIYTGWVQSTGKKFDSSYDEKSGPIPVKPLGQAQIIPGWNEGLVGMQYGGTRRLIIPPALAYGAQAQGPIPANATLIFDVTVTAIK